MQENNFSTVGGSCSIRCVGVDSNLQSNLVPGAHTEKMKEKKTAWRERNRTKTDACIGRVQVYGLRAAVRGKRIDGA